MALFSRIFFGLGPNNSRMVLRPQGLQGDSEDGGSSEEHLRLDSDRLSASGETERSSRFHADLRSDHQMCGGPATVRREFIANGMGESVRKEEGSGATSRGS